MGVVKKKEIVAIRDGFISIFLVDFGGMVWYSQYQIRLLSNSSRTCLSQCLSLSLSPNFNLDRQKHCTVHLNQTQTNHLYAAIHSTFLNPSFFINPSIHIPFPTHDLHHLPIPHHSSVGTHARHLWYRMHPPLKEEGT